MHPDLIRNHPNLAPPDLDHWGPPARAPWRSWALGGFVLFSGLVHAALLWLPSAPPPARDGGTSGTLQVSLAAAPASPTPAPPAPSAQQKDVASAATRREPAPVEASAAVPAQPPQNPDPAPARKAASKPADARARIRRDAAPAAQQRPRFGPAMSANGPSASAVEDDARQAAASAPTRVNPTATGAVDRQAAPVVQRDRDVAEHLRQQLGRSLRAHFHYPRIARHRGWEGLVEVGLRVEANGRLSEIRILRTSGFAVLDRAALASVGRIHHLRDAPRWLGGHAMDLVLPVQYRLIDG